MTIEQAELILEEKEKYPGPIVDKAANMVMKDHFLEETMMLRRE